MRSRLSVALLLSTAVAGLWLAPRGLSQESPGQAVGLAAKYPGDKGIEGDPAVIFAEGFEAKDLPTAQYGKPGIEKNAVFHAGLLVGRGQLSGLVDLLAVFVTSFLREQLLRDLILTSLGESN